MSPKEKADQLQLSMKKCLYSDGMFDAKQCAIVAASEVLKYASKNTIHIEHGKMTDYEFWDCVITELNLLQ